MNKQLIAAIRYLEAERLTIPEDMNAAEIINWAAEARANDAMADRAGFLSIEDYCGANDIPCFIN